MRADGLFVGGGLGVGLAFAGALQAAAEGGYSEWIGNAGSSSGAVAAMSLAVGYDPAELVRIFDPKSVADAVEHPRRRRRTTRPLFRTAARGTPGLTSWLEDILAQAPKPVTVFGELPHRLSVIGTDLAHSRMVVFPEDIALYEDLDGRPLDPGDFPIADAVRVSVSHPLVFEPLTTLRDRVTKKQGVLVDGFITNPFPVEMFDKPTPQHPTWGFRLHGGSSPERPEHQAIGGADWIVDILRGILDTTRDAFASLNMEQYGRRAVSIPTYQLRTIGFTLAEETGSFLYEAGYETAKEFFATHADPTNSYGVRVDPGAVA